MRKKPPKVGAVAKATKYIKVLSTSPDEVFTEIGKKVLKKELKWAYHKIEDGVGVHYYLILKRKR